MKRNIKVLGIALVAILAMSAVAASMSSAAQIKTTPGFPTTVTVTGGQHVKNVFKTTAGSAECNTITGHATLNTPTPTATLTNIVYGGPCTCFGFSCTIDMNGCDYLMHLNTVSGNTVDVICEPGKEITLTASQAGTTKCIVHVPAQTGLKTFTPTEIGSGSTDELTIHLEISGVKYSHTEGSGLGKCTPGSGTTGTLAGAILATGEEDKVGGAHIPIIIE